MTAPEARGGWGKVRLSPRGIRESLQRRYRLGWHGYALGSTTLLATWLASHALMLGGLDSLAVRYALSLGAGYAVYLLVLRWWAHRLVAPRRETAADDGGSGADAVDGLVNLSDVPLPRLPPRSGGGGDFGGGGASGDFGDAGAPAAESQGWVGEALGAAASADEGIVIVPVVAVFVAVIALVLGVGTLALLYFGSEVLLAVAVELAFAYTSARAASRVSREGWLTAAVRLTWKPLLGSLLCAVALGAAIDWGLPDARSLPDAVRLLRGNWF